MTAPATAAPAQLYVYYRLAAARDDALRTIVGLLAEVEARSGIAGRLLMRRDDEATWMEVYRDVRDVDSFRAMLEDAALRHGAAGIAHDGARHVECFVPVVRAQEL